MSSSDGDVNDSSTGPRVQRTEPIYLHSQTAEQSCESKKVCIR